MPRVAAQRARRSALLWMAATACVALIVVGCASDELRVVTGSEAPDSAGDPTSAPTSSAAAVGRSSVETVETVESVVSSAPVDVDALAVSYLNPPPLFEPQPFVELSVPSAPAWVALAEQFAVVGSGDLLTVVDRATGATRDMVVDAMPIALLAGPGPVIYGEVFFQAPDVNGAMAQFVAIAVDGGRSGQVVRSLPSIGRAIEAYDNIFEHASNGVIDRWHEDSLVMPFVDAVGRPPAVDG